MSINIPQLSFELVWLDLQLNIIANQTMRNHMSNDVFTIQTVEVTFQSIELANAGRYTCTAIFPSSHNFSQHYDLIVQGMP